MTDEELLQCVEAYVIERMLIGSVVDESLEIGGWGLKLRADIVSRLIDMARESRPKETA